MVFSLSARQYYRINLNNYTNWHENIISWSCIEIEFLALSLSILFQHIIGTMPCILFPKEG